MIYASVRIEGRAAAIQTVSGGAPVAVGAGQAQAHSDDHAAPPVLALKECGCGTLAVAVGHDEFSAYHSRPGAVPYGCGAPGGVRRFNVALASR